VPPALGTAEHAICALCLWSSERACGFSPLIVLEEWETPQYPWLTIFSRNKKDEQKKVMGI
jgi:hypothetical protein